jgi:putative phosphoribosyl transferase
MKEVENSMSDIFIPIGGRRVAAELVLPPQARGAVVFVHGSGVDRHDARNRFVAAELRKAGLAGVAIDLLEPCEARDRCHVFDVELQCGRLLAALDWLQQRRQLRAPFGYFGTGVGAGVALLAAARQPAKVAAVVTRGGRPDTALYALAGVRAPTLFIVDEECRWSELAMERLQPEKELAVVPSASHFFDEPRAQKAVAQHALRWFSRYLGAAARADCAAA